jgi:cytochrome c peroxidase
MYLIQAFKATCQLCHQRKNEKDNHFYNVELHHYFLILNKPLSHKL